MNNTIKNISLLLSGALIGSALIIYTLPYIQPYLGIASPMGQDTMSSSSEPEPLYWVAPMDANFRRDKPGLSPMGMDLVPFYPSGDNSSPGTISVSPEVVNNLGVKLAKVLQQPLQLQVNTVGYVKYNQDQMVHVHPRVEGWLEKVYVTSAGEPVKKGQALYKLYSPELVNAQEEFIFALKRNDKRLINAAQRRLRSLQLPEKAIRQLRKDRELQQSVTFYAPISGVVENFAMQAGFFVKPGKMLMSIVALDQVWVEAQVFERQASLITLGAPVSVKLDYLPNREWRTTVDYIYPTLDKMNRTLRVRLRLDNQDLVLKPNMYADVKIEVPQTKPILSVPREALIRVGNQDRVVLSLGQGRFKSIAVTAGRSDSQRIEILEGLKKNEIVVSSAQFLLDSESSKTSDFKRIDVADEQEGTAKMKDEEPSAVWVLAQVDQQMRDQMQVKLTHQAIPQWQWPVMTMNFKLDEKLNFDKLAIGQELAVKLARGENNQYRLLDTAPADQISEMMEQESQP
ncbi:MAG: efflux RND transporter periplasmic adaptor subunit [Oceanospirillaceae bacterium]